MSQSVPGKFKVAGCWGSLIDHLGLQIPDLLARAKLPPYLLSQPNASVTAPEFYRLWQQVDEMYSGPQNLAIRLGSALLRTDFDFAVFAASCAQNFQESAELLAKYKSLVVPVCFLQSELSEQFIVKVDFFEPESPSLVSLALTEIVCLLTLARVGTQSRLVPMSVTIKGEFNNDPAYEKFFGIAPEQGEYTGIALKLEDSKLAFKTRNDALLSVLQEELGRRLRQHSVSAPYTVKVQRELIALLPLGKASVAGLADRIGCNERTLQRRLKAENTNFRSILAHTRHELAIYYLAHTKMSVFEVSRLLGYEDQSAFFKAFQQWTGYTPSRLIRAPGADAVLYG